MTGNLLITLVIVLAATVAADGDVGIVTADRFHVDVVIINDSPLNLSLVGYSLSGGEVKESVPASLPSYSKAGFAIEGEFLRDITFEATFEGPDAGSKQQITTQLEMPLLSSTNYCLLSFIRQGAFQGESTITSGSSAEATFRVVAAAPPEKDFLLFGHAGSPRYHCENTIIGFADALDRGANCIELDLSMMEDGLIVVWHDWDPDNSIALARQLGLEGLKCRPWVPDKGSSWRRRTDKLTYSELKDHYGYTTVPFAEGEECKVACLGDPSCIAKCVPRTNDTIPTFEEFVKTIATDPRMRHVFLDTKVPEDSPVELTNQFMEGIYSVLQSYGVVEKAIFSSPYEGVQLDMRAWLAKMAGPEIAIQSNYDGQIPPGIVIDPPKYSSMKHAVTEQNIFSALGKPVVTIRAWTVFHDIVKYDLNMRNVYNMEKLSQGKGDTQIKYILWTLDEELDFKTFIPMGIDGFLTNNVSYALEFL